MSLKRTREELAKAQETLDLHNHFREVHNSSTWLIDWFWKQKLAIAERIGRGQKEKGKTR